MKITLARALKEKNRIKREMSRLQKIIQSHNSQLADKWQSPYVIKDVLLRYSQLKDNLIYLKTKIQEANIPIYGFIFQMSEARSMIDWLSSLDTRDGKHESPYNDSINEYRAQINRQELDEILRELTLRIDELQDKIDEFNHTTKIDIEYPYAMDGDEKSSTDNDEK